MRQNRLLCILLIVAAIIAVFSGCLSSKNEEDPYIMVEALDAPQYAAFLNKELSPCINNVNTVVLFAKSYIQNTATREELSNEIDAAVAVLDAAYSQIEVMTPPKQYTENRQRILTLLTDAIDHMTNLKEATSKGTGNVQTYIDRLTSVFLGLSNEFGAYYK